VGRINDNRYKKKYPGLLEKWYSGEIVEIPNGELWVDFVRRINQGIISAERLLAPNSNIIMVVHAGTLRAVNYILNQPYERYRNLGGRWIIINNSRMYYSEAKF